MNRIGPFHFVNLTGPPLLAQPQVITRRRPGTNGVQVQRMGISAEDFEAVSFVDVPTFTGAWNLYQQYRTLVGGPPVEVVWGSQSMALAGHTVFVLAVYPLDQARTVLGVGGLNGISFAKLRCLWRLQPVVIPPEEPENGEGNGD